MRNCICLCILLVLKFTVGLPTCTDPWLEFQGYTYTVDPVSGERLWSHCKFPNPVADLSRCGISTISGSSYICDPDGLLQSSKIETINNLLVAIQQNTSTLCTSTEKQRQSYIVAVALVDRIRVADLQDPNSCINSCNELQPALNTSTRAATESEVNSIIENFANSLRASWQLGACENDVIIFYNRQYNRIYTSVGAKASERLSSSKLASLEATFLQNVMNGNIEEGLLLFVEDIKSSLRSFTPAHILLVINMVFIALMIVFFIFFLHLSDVELNVWGREKQWWALDIIMKLVTGVWFLEGLFYVMGHFFHKVSIWMAVVCAIAAVGCLVIFFQEDKIFPSRFFSDKVNFTG